MPNRYLDWMRQARRDLSHAKNAFRDEDYEWACFASQQAAEKAVKAVFEYQHAEAWGHSITALLQRLSKRVPISDDLQDRAKELDKNYIPTRYPNGFDVGAPLDYYTKKEAKRALENAEAIIGFCESYLRKQEGGAGAGG